MQTSKEAFQETKKELQASGTGIMLNDQLGTVKPVSLASEGTE